MTFLGRVSRNACAAGILMLVLLAPVAHAAEPFEKVETVLSLTAASFPRGVRNIGMGAAGASNTGGFRSGYYNPACFAWQEMPTVGTGFNEWLGILSFTDTRVSASRRWPSGDDGDGWMIGGSLGYSTMSIDAGEERTIYLPEGSGEEVKYTDYYVSGAVAGGFTRGMWEGGAGAAVKYLDADFPGAYSLWAFDLGAVVAADIFRSADFTVRPRIGASLLHIGGDIEFENGSTAEQPGASRLGFGLDLATPPNSSMTEAFRRSVAVLGISVDYDLVDGVGSNDADGWAFGLEVSVFELLQVRYGRNEDVYSSHRYDSYGVGLGWDFGTIAVQLDYARIDPEEAIIVLKEEDVYGVSIGARLF